MASIQLRFVAIASLSESVKQQMGALYLCAYDASNEALFSHDLSSKDELLLVHCAGELVGFTTLRAYERDWKGERIRVVYSGDTIVSAEALGDSRHWPLHGLPGWGPSSVKTLSHACIGCCL
jgi:hypothetical protein